MIRIEAVIGFARAAGQAILGRSTGQRAGCGSLVTAREFLAHTTIVDGLTGLEPATPIVSRVSGVPPVTDRAGWRRFWLVNPLDGVTGQPDCTVNIGLVEMIDGCAYPILGVVDAPFLGLTYWAARGSGAWRQCAASTPTRVHVRPPAAGAALRVIHSRSNQRSEVEPLVRGRPIAEWITMDGALSFCWIAEGRADLYPRPTPMMEWDAAAGDCILRQSGLIHSSLEYNHADMRVANFVVGFAPPRPTVVWLTGLPGAGKTTVARAVRESLDRLGVRTELLDGDDIRAVFPSTGYSRDARDGHVRRIGHLASRLEHHGVTSIVSLVSPYRESRDFARKLCRRFVEVYVSTPADECERRDPKGLYREARAGRVAQFTGISDPYEPPERSELTIDTRTVTAEAGAKLIVDWLLSEGDEGR
jgi:adenylylsulfate kinase